VFRSIYGWFFVLILGAGLPVSATAAGNGAGQHEGIETRAQASMDAVARCDAAAIAATCTPDAQMLPANSSTISAREAIRALRQTLIDEDLGGLKLVPIEIRVFWQRRIRHQLLCAHRWQRSSHRLRQVSRDLEKIDMRAPAGSTLAP
jgi:hypothetical protein